MKTFIICFVLTLPLILIGCAPKEENNPGYRQTYGTVSNSEKTKPNPNLKSYTNLEFEADKKSIEVIEEELELQGLKIVHTHHYNYDHEYAGYRRKWNEFRWNGELLENHLSKLNEKQDALWTISSVSHLERYLAVLKTYHDKYAAEHNLVGDFDACTITRLSSDNVSILKGKIDLIKETIEKLKTISRKTQKSSEKTF